MILSFLPMDFNFQLLIPEEYNLCQKHSVTFHTIHMVQIWAFVNYLTQLAWSTWKKKHICYYQLPVFTFSFKFTIRTNRLLQICEARNVRTWWWPSTRGGQLKSSKFFICMIMMLSYFSLVFLLWLFYQLDHPTLNVLNNSILNTSHYLK